AGGAGGAGVRGGERAAPAARGRGRAPPPRPGPPPPPPPPRPPSTRPTVDSPRRETVHPAHAPRTERRLLGLPHAPQHGSDRRGRPPRLPLGLDGRSLRLGCRDPPRVHPRADRAPPP